MKVRLNVILNALENYSCGDCKKCPIHQESYFSTHQYEETKISCPLGYTSISCPLEPQAESETECEPLLSKNDVLDAFGHGSVYTSDDIQRIVNGLPLVTK